MKKNLFITAFAVLIILVVVAAVAIRNTGHSRSTFDVSVAVKKTPIAKMPVITNIVHFSPSQGGYSSILPPPPPTKEDIKHLVDQIPQDVSTPTMKGVAIVSFDEMPRVLAANDIPPEVVIQETRKTLSAMREKGFVEVEAEVIAAFERTAVNGKSLEEIQNDLTFVPASEIKGELVGAEAHGSFNDERWNMLTRTWKDRNGNLIQLEEWDMGLGGGALVSKEMIDQTKVSVGGLPSVVVIQKNSETGKVIGEIAWYTKDKGYVLRSTNASVNKSDLAALARSIRD